MDRDYIIRELNKVIDWDNIKPVNWMDDETDSYESYENFLLINIRMSCVQIKAPKYQTRNSPPYHAKDCKGQTKKGNDGKLYISTVDGRGVYKWVLKKGTKTYNIIDSGSITFSVDIIKADKKIEVYKQKYKYIEKEEKSIRDKKIYETKYTDLFIGDNYLNDKNFLPKGKQPGNSIIIEVERGKYVYCGHEVYIFETNNKENIKKYYSPVGNSYVPYPYAVGEKYTYFMLEKKTLPNELLNLKEDAYGQYYGWTVKDEAVKKKIQDSYKKFKTKMIHKRNLY